MPDPVRLRSLVHTGTAFDTRQRACDCALIDACCMSDEVPHDPVVIVNSLFDGSG